MQISVCMLHFYKNPLKLRNVKVGWVLEHSSQAACLDLFCEARTQFHIQDFLEGSLKDPDLVYPLQFIMNILVPSFYRRKLGTERRDPPRSQSVQTAGPGLERRSEGLERSRNRRGVAQRRSMWALPSSSCAIHIT